MKNLFLGLVITGLIAGCNSTPENAKKLSFKVWGNCGMCNKTIEKSLKIDGVKKASWDVNSKELTVSFDPKKTNLKTIQTAVCNAGYDNDGCKGSDAAYEKLHTCCKYDRK